jgi:nucleoside-diphosphate-sugar epimerase
MKVLLTGATGFVGGNVARVLELMGDDVFCLVRGVPDRTGSRRPGPRGADRGSPTHTPGAPQHSSAPRRRIRVPGSVHG